MVRSGGSQLQSLDLNEQSRQVPTAEEEEEFARQKVSADLLQYVNGFKFPYMNDVSSYAKLNKIGQGTFGEVFKARCRKTGRIVALKKILLENENRGFPITALREVKMLKQLKHKHITELIEICSTKGGSSNDRYIFYLVFTFCDHDLAGLLCKANVEITPVHQKTLMKHLLLGLYQIHRSRILHRDLKSANVLITQDGILKLADFGLARPHAGGGAQKPVYTDNVVTLWYRSPELLFGERRYGTAIDMWSAGCIMAELGKRSPILKGATDQKQLELIVNLCGSITRDVWPNVESIPMFHKILLPKDRPRIVRQELRKYIKEERALCLVDKLLTIDPDERISAEDALDDEYFFTHPLPNDDIRDLMAGIGSSMFEYTVGAGAYQGRRQEIQAQAAASSGPKPPPRKQSTNTGGYKDMIF